MHKTCLLALVWCSEPVADVCSYSQEPAAQRETESLNPAREERSSVSGSEDSEKVQLTKPGYNHQIAEIRKLFNLLQRACVYLQNVKLKIVSGYTWLPFSQG